MPRATKTASSPPARAARSKNAQRTSLEAKLVEAVRNSLNLPRLRIETRRGRIPGCRLICLCKGRSRSEWLELDRASVAIARKVGVLPPRLLGVFRLAYDEIKS